MQLNYIGIIAALSTFLAIWFGHTAVRKIEFTSPTIWLPTAIFATSGIALEYWSLITDNWPLSATFGIVGITLLWDALEFTRQQRRVRKGHAPANPCNPRHTKILAEYLSATTVDLLNKPNAR
jgi:hypothetical protein